MYYTHAGRVKLGNLIREFRKSQGLNSRDFGSLVGTAHSTITRIEAAKQLPDPETLAKLAPIMGLTMEKLQAIASETDLAKRRTCEEMLPLVSEMPIDELRKLQACIDKQLREVEALENNFTDRS